MMLLLMQSQHAVQSCDAPYPSIIDFFSRAGQVMLAGETAATRTMEMREAGEELQNHHTLGAIIGVEV